ncbi:GNAT family N-acetyltransferase [Kitasatospora sp. SUK 42]|uniref:GNAT family N-acetyltransferase n=1 Tax=Kitasatospora sp. SUK 42 TaxID=1588882 RepID=UPI0018CB891A|nr:GNAT family N-acetyltransferase [Kitasatospora sp. SUK 42]MBV2153287.1 GNAT family N-acetyltransferase [Kitasatospora sp. SUK 42]
MQIVEIDDHLTDANWRELWESDPVQHPSYLDLELEAAAAHFQPLYYLPPDLQYHHDPDSFRGFEPHRLLAGDEEGPVMGLTVTVDRFAAHTRLSAFGRPLCVVQNRHARPARLKSAARMLHRELESLRTGNGAEAYHVRDFMVDGEVSPFGELVLRGGAVSRPFFTQVINLSSPLDETFQAFRANLRTVIRKPRPGLVVERISGPDADEEHRDVLRDLHVLMRGRSVRPQAYWDAALACVRADQGFFLLGKEDGDYVAGAYFPCSDAYCYYAAAAHDPQRKAAGISHRMLWEAIQYAESRGCTSFEVGDRVYPAEHSWVDGKLHTISHFKSGFGGSSRVRLDLLVPGRG